MDKKEQSKLRMRKMRNKDSVTSDSVTSPSVTWETIPIKEIKAILPSYLVKEIEALAEYDQIRQRPVTLEDRLRKAYKYHVWHGENFIKGIHKDLAR